MQLSSSSIATIEPGAFDGLENLTSLDMYANELAAVSVGIFRGLEHLKELNMAANVIKTIEAGSFAHLQNLAYLDLHANGILSLTTGCFSGLSQLTTLNLAEQAPPIPRSNIAIVDVIFGRLIWFLVVKPCLESVSLKLVHLLVYQACLFWKYETVV